MTNFIDAASKYPLIGTLFFGVVAAYAWRQIYTANARGYLQSFNGGGRLERGEWQFARSLFVWHLWRIFAGALCVVSVLVAIAPYVPFLTWVK